MSFEIKYLVKELPYGSKPYVVYKTISYDSGGIRHEHVEAFRTRKQADELAERMNKEQDG